MSNSRQFKCIIIQVSDDDKKVAMKHLIDTNKKPTLGNVAKVLRTWATNGIRFRSTLVSQKGQTTQELF